MSGSECADGNTALVPEITTELGEGQAGDPAIYSYQSQESPLLVVRCQERECWGAKGTQSRDT